MPSLSKLLALCLLFLSSVAVAQAQPHQSPWQSFGTFQIESQSPEGSPILRMVRFSNGEFMAEIENGALKKQLLRVLPSQLTLYSGLGDDESPRPGSRNPFMFLELGFAYPALALHQAYPSGAGSVPEVRTQQEVVLENRHPAKLTTIRTSITSVQFQLTLQSITVNGTWDGNQRDPLPDDFRLPQWTRQTPTTLTTLGEARSLPATGRP